MFIETVIRQRAGAHSSRQGTLLFIPSLWCKVPKSLEYMTEGGNGSRVKSNPELFSREVKVPTTAPRADLKTFKCKDSSRVLVCSFTKHLNRLKRFPH